MKLAVAPASVADDAIVVVLTAILAELRAQRADRGFADDNALADLLHVILAHIGNRTFNSSSLLIHSRLPIAVALRDAIVRTVGAANARLVGKALAYAEGRDFDGLTVTRVGDDANGVVWTITTL